MIKKLLLWYKSSRLHSLLVLHVLWRIRLSNFYTKFQGYQFHLGYQYLKPGDLVVCVDPAKPITKVIGGNFSHAALCVRKGPSYVSTDDQGRIAYTHPAEINGMEHSGLVQNHFFDICHESERVAIFRNDLFDDEYIQLMLEKNKELKAKIRRLYYDPKLELSDLKKIFELGVADLYCSEYYMLLDFEKREAWDLQDLAGLGCPYISPDGLTMAPHMRCVWDSAGKLTGLTGPEIQSMMGIK